MRDHNYLEEDGTRIPVAKLPIEKIVDLLSDGAVRIDNSDGGPGDTSENVIERLRIELLIRELNL